MKFRTIKIAALSLVVAATAYNCSNEKMDNTYEIDGVDSVGNTIKGTYIQEDQMARPAVNTVFVSSGSKDAFNTTVPSNQGAAFQSMFQNNLLALNPGYTTNALGLDAATFTSVLATDVLTLSLDGTTTFFDGTNVLTGRALADDVITVELILIFGGPDALTGMPQNVGLIDDHVDANDVAFSSSFPYLASPHLQ
ncbi:uncharacterized protein DUF4331 [Flavobacteriaceae bacterium MAR_2010_105]|nr:uncharacterized protein DUF4331 [Flavobacteriaceae bacterium MAR_2010_105]